MTTATAAEELLPRIVSHPRASMERVLDRQGAVWDLIRQHPRYDPQATDFVDPLCLCDQAVFADGSVLEWSRAGGWAAGRGEHSPFPHTQLIRHDGERWRYFERMMAGQDGTCEDWHEVTAVQSGRASGGWHDDV